MILQKLEETTTDSDCIFTLYISLYNLKSCKKKNSKILLSMLTVNIYNVYMVPGWESTMPYFNQHVVAR